MGATFSQFFPPAPSLTEANLPSQSGKIFLITGSTSGVGYQLASILYHAGATVYLTARSEPQALKTIADIKASARPPNCNPTWAEPSGGRLEYLCLDLSDLATIKPAAQQFLRQEKKLDVLFNNAGVALPPAGSVSAQGHDLTLTTNCLGPFLLTQLLHPALLTAVSSSSGTARVIWTSSIAVDLSAPPSGGIDIASLRNSAWTSTQHPQTLYTLSKTGNYFLATELARRHGSQGQDHGRSPAPGILSLTANPGNLRTNLLRHTNGWLGFLASPLLYDARFGALTELWAGLSTDLDGEGGRGQNGGYVVPWGRMHEGMRRDLEDAARTVEEGGLGRAGEFWEWCEELTRDYQ